MQWHSALHAPGQLANWQLILHNLQAEQPMAVTYCKLHFNSYLLHLARALGTSTARKAFKVSHGQYGRYQGESCTVWTV